LKPKLQLSEMKAERPEENGPTAQRMQVAGS
jgi:hypothetical protein